MSNNQFFLNKQINFMNVISIFTSNENHKTVITPKWSEKLNYCSFFGLFTVEINNNSIDTFADEFENLILTQIENNPTLFDFLNSSISNTVIDIDNSFNNDEWMNIFKSFLRCNINVFSKDKTAIACIMNPYKIVFINKGYSKAIIVNNNNKLKIQTNSNNNDNQITEPNILILNRDNNIKYIFIATAEFWQNMSNEEVIEYISEVNLNSQHDLKCACNYLINVAIEKQLELNDNISVLLITLDQTNINLKNQLKEYQLLNLNLIRKYEQQNNSNNNGVINNFEINRLNDKIQQFESEIQLKSNEIKRLVKELSELNEAYLKLKCSNEAIDQKIKSLEDEIQMYKNELAIKQTQLERLKNVNKKQKDTEINLNEEEINVASLLEAEKT